MKIGILTLPLHTNYGGILQAYALQTVLEQMGHEVCLIEKRRKPAQLSLWKTPWTYGKRIYKNITGHSIPIFYEQKINREAPVIRRYTDKFINKYIKRKFIDDFSDIQRQDFDAMIVGSDQVWRPEYFIDKIEHAYLDFTQRWNIKRIAYAASFGTDDWLYTDRQTEKCKRLIHYFDAVSVREKSGVDFCRKYFDIEAKHILDPTMLLAVEEYIRIFKIIGTPQSNGTLLSYILDETPSKLSLINRIAIELDLVPFKVYSNIKNYNEPISKRIQPPVEQWLRGFYDAEFIVTDSFHACVFAILFNKPFVVIGNEKRGMSRLSSLLEIFGLYDRLITGATECKLSCNIKWDDINLQLNDKRMESKEFLIQNLK